jgi:sterol desaturase/sphingolipid hydroxylase (fatty acid hydroxylase superfamily)
MIGIPLGWLYANATEWVAHRYLLHGLGKNKTSFWFFHWGEHHGVCRKHAMEDVAYRKPLNQWNSQTKEAAALVVGCLAHLPIAPIAPFFFGTLVNRAINYYQVHKRAHLDPQWAKDHLPWHYDHHMGKDQDANWCVTHPFFDYVLGTRKHYLGTAEERKDITRKQRRKSVAA